MPLNKAQLMSVPGGPGITGAVKAGTGIAIAADGTISIDPNTVLAKLVAGQNISLTPNSGVGTVRIDAVPDQGGDFPRGTVTLFVQSSAPAGWTQVTSQNNKAIRVVNGSGGGTGGSNPFTSTFTSVPVTGSVSFSGLSVSGGRTNTVSQTPSGSVTLNSLSVGSTTIGVGEMPSHRHGYRDNNNSTNTQGGNQNRPEAQNNSNNTDNTGGNGGHSHSVSGSGTFNGNNMSHDHSFNASVSGNGSFQGNSINLELQYVDAILCSRN